MAKKDQGIYGKELVDLEKQLQAEKEKTAKAIENIANAERNKNVSAELKQKAIAALTEKQLRIEKQQVDAQTRIANIRITNLKSLGQQEASLKSLSGIYDGLKEIDRERLVLQRSMAESDPKRVESFNKIAGLNRDLAQLSSEDTIQREIILERIRATESSMGGLSAEEQVVMDKLREGTTYANQMSYLTESQKEQLEAQVKAYEGIKKTIGGILGTAGLLFSGFRGFARITLLGAGKALTELGKTTREFGGYLGGATVSATALGTVFKDATGTAKSLSSEFGGLTDISFQNQLNTNLMATNMGISGDEAARLTGNLARLNGGSIETAQNLAEGTKELAKQNGLVPADIMKDMAGSAEAFALFGKEGGKNIAQAAVQAAKMGTSLKTMTGIADNLLDFENSITKELELGAMLGKNINLDKARQLAYSGDIAGATQETLRALGGVDAFNKMDYFQKKATAELMGVSVDELQKMVTQQEKAATIGGQIEGGFNTMTQSLTALTTGPLGGFVSGLSGAIGTSKEIAGNFKDAGGFLKDMGGKLKSFFGGKKPEIPGQSSVGSAAPKPPTAPQTQAGPADQANKMSKVNGNALIKGAVALLILAAALFVAAKAFQEFAEVTWESVGMGLVALVGLAGIAFLLSKIQGEMIKGALAVAILGLALIPFAYALNLMSAVNGDGLIAAGIALVAFTAAVFGLGLLMMGPAAIVFGAGILALTALGAALVVFGAGLLMVGNGMSALTGALPAMVEQIAALSTINFLPIFGLAGALMALSVALAAVAVTGMLALPALLALGLVAGGASALMGGGDEGGEGAKMDELITEIKGLRSDLLAGKIAVNMDGQKLTSGIGKIVSKNSTNSYAKT